MRRRIKREITELGSRRRVGGGRGRKVGERNVDRERSRETGDGSQRLKHGVYAVTM